MDAGTPPPPPASGGRAIFELVIATIPAVVLYFIGWAYLNFYLRNFGIYVSELDLDIQTIFIYSFPPFQMLVRLHGILIVSGIAILIAVTWFIHRFVSPGIAQGLLLLAILVALAVFSLPVIQSTATEAANRKWSSEGIHIEALIKEPETKSTWHESYKRCAARRALDLIFSDKESIYMICISTVDKSNALVFEVRRDAGLMSVRFIRRD